MTIASLWSLTTLTNSEVLLTIFCNNAPGLSGSYSFIEAGEKLPESSCLRSIIVLLASTFLLFGEFNAFVPVKGLGTMSPPFLDDKPNIEVCPAICAASLTSVESTSIMSTGKMDLSLLRTSPVLFFLLPAVLAAFFNLSQAQSRMAL